MIMVEIDTIDMKSNYIIDMDINYVYSVYRVKERREE